MVLVSTTKLKMRKIYKDEHRDSLRSSTSVCVCKTLPRAMIYYLSHSTANNLNPNTNLTLNKTMATEVATSYSASICFIWRSCAQQLLITIYSTSAVESKMQFCLRNHSLDTSIRSIYYCRTITTLIIKRE